MLSTQSLRDQLDRYADGVLSPEALEEWLASESWDMSRWVPRGLQHIVEALQGAFIDYSDERISLDDLRRILLQRRDQLHQARAVTERVKAAKAKLAEAIAQAKKEHETIAGSEALILESASA